MSITDVQAAAEAYQDARNAVATETRERLLKLGDELAEASLELIQELRR